MTYSVEFFENEMAVLGEKKGKDEVATINFVTGRAHFRLAKVDILCADRSLNMFLRDLRGNFRALKEKKRSGSNSAISVMAGPGKTLGWNLIFLRALTSEASLISLESYCGTSGRCWNWAKSFLNSLSAGP